MALVVFSATTVIVVGVVIEIRATDNVVVGLAGINVDVSGYVDDYQLLVNDQRSWVPLHSF